MVQSINRKTSGLFCEATVYALHSSDDFCDVTFVCTDNKDIRAHKFILAHRSRYFRGKLYQHGDSVQENCKVNKHYKFPAGAKVLHNIKEYLYTGSIVALEDPESFEGQAGLQQWTGLVKNAAGGGMGGLDEYLNQLLINFPATTFSAAARRFSFADQLKLPTVMAAMAKAMSSLPFHEDGDSEDKHRRAFAELSEDALVVVLEDVYLPTTERNVCLAVMEWVADNLIGWPDEVGAIPERIVDALGIEYISVYDLTHTVIQDLFDDTKIYEVKKMVSWMENEQDADQINVSRGSKKNWDHIEQVVRPDRFGPDDSTFSTTFQSVTI